MALPGSEGQEWPTRGCTQRNDPPHYRNYLYFKAKRNSPCRAICNETTRQHCGYGTFSFLLFKKKPQNHNPKTIFLCAGPSRSVSKRGEQGFPFQDIERGFSWKHWRNSPSHPPHPLLPFPAFSSPSPVFGHSPRCIMCAAPGSCYFQQWRRTTHHPG